MLDGRVQQVGYASKLLLSKRWRRKIDRRVLGHLDGVVSELDLLRGLVSTVDGYVDVGAAEGLFLAALSPFDLPMVGFEPDPKSARLLRRAFPEVTVHEVALGSVPGQATLCVPRTEAGRRIATLGSLRQVELDGVSPQRYPVPVRTLDGFDLPAGRLMLKVDVEGLELEVLRGAGDTLDSVEVALVESEERHAPGAPAEVVDLMAGHGFIGHLILGDRLLPAEQYEPDVHQSAALTDRLTDARLDPEDVSRYGNNFLFVRRPLDRGIESS